MEHNSVTMFPMVIVMSHWKQSQIDSLSLIENGRWISLFLLKSEKLELTIPSTNYDLQHCIVIDLNIMRLDKSGTVSVSICSFAAHQAADKESGLPHSWGQQCMHTLHQREKTEVVIWQCWGHQHQSFCSNSDLIYWPCLGNWWYIPHTT